ncbi:hypothetical protein TVAG_090750 [Trichomonas vaginalis G3]|uniref:Uncharacterized protein n=1 Tax=Trichomonas vaginalis (strain ATCC PRA-98 / G3) TaxID=412133 RepID=A2F912_TRIV3|nr:glycoprotein 38 family [Trichomonas vaginalis G3]EAX98587.1 hypothetical protein TVAG_090750 [Trichomonas vaginalis G3]KAI5498376.1 glycoprotein 38 family [Trichomonas vaginalis G3]|eukprot:XP_001311517.1 hypothetical protein [Trichomonas vaginalis G3]
MIRNMLTFGNLTYRVPLTISPRDAFPECTIVQTVQNIGIPRIYPLKNNELFCLVGSCMIAGKGDYEGTTAVPVNKSGKVEFIKSDPIKNLLVSLGQLNTIAESIPVTKIECLSSDGCRVQYMGVTPSVYLKYDEKILGIRTHNTVGFKTIVSTLRKGNIKLGVSTSYELEDDKSVDTKRIIAHGIISTPDLKKGTFKREKYADFALKVNTSKLNNHKERSGTLPEATSYQLISGLNYAESEDYSPGSSIKISGSTTINWEPSKNEAQLENDAEWYYPEVSATLSTSGGAYTKDNINQKYPGDGSSAGVIVAVVVICMLVACIIIGVVIYFMKKKKADSYNEV